jgi:uncharacterized membrane protein
MVAAALDVISMIGQDQRWATDVYRAATYTLTAGLFVSVFAALTGFWDWFRSTEKGTQARRTASAHGLTMVCVTVLALTDAGLRWFAYYDDAHTGVVVLVLSLAVAVLTVAGAAIGGELVFDYGFNVETAGDSPVWHKAEVDVLPFRPGAVAELPPANGSASEPSVPERSRS